MNKRIRKKKFQQQLILKNWYCPDCGEYTTHIPTNQKKYGDIVYKCKTCKGLHPIYFEALCCHCGTDLDCYGTVLSTYNFRSYPTGLETWQTQWLCNHCNTIQVTDDSN